jgi:hypothetical protein
MSRSRSAEDREIGGRGPSVSAFSAAAWLARDLSAAHSHAGKVAKWLDVTLASGPVDGPYSRVLQIIDPQGASVTLSQFKMPE